MADEKQKTVSFKLDTDFQEEVVKKLQEITETQNMTRKEWFEKAFALMEAQELKEQSPEFTMELNELETHTTRIYELVSNMIKRSNHLREHAIHTWEQQLEQQREITMDYQMRVKGANEERDQALEDLEASQSEQNQLMDQLEEIRETLETNKLLVNQYKEKNDVLNGLVAKYESYATENEQLKETLTTDRISYQSKIDELTRQNSNHTTKIKELEQEMATQNESHKNAIERLRERLEVEQEKSLLKAERQHQKDLSDANNAYSEKLQSLYDNMDKQRLSYEKKINELQRQLDDERKNNKKKNIGDQNNVN